MYWFRMNIRDYEADTKALDFRLHGAYFALMRLAYHTERPLTKHRPTLYDLVNARKATDKKAVDEVLIAYFIETDFGYIQRRIEREIATYQKTAERNRANGRKGGRPSRAETQSVMEIADSVPITGTEDDDFENPAGYADENPVGYVEEPSGLSNGFRLGNPEKSHTRNKNQNNRVADALVVARASKTATNPSLQSSPHVAGHDDPNWLAERGSPVASSHDAAPVSDASGAGRE